MTYLGRECGCRRAEEEEEEEEEIQRQSSACFKHQPCQVVAFLVPQLLVLRRQIDLHHGVHGVGAPLAVLAARVEVRQRLVRAVVASLRQPLAEVQPGLERCPL
jgi:hypothetical protein